MELCNDCDIAYESRTSYGQRKICPLCAEKIIVKELEDQIEQLKQEINNMEIP